MSSLSGEYTTERLESKLFQGLYVVFSHACRGSVYDFLMLAHIECLVSEVINHVHIRKKKKAHRENLTILNKDSVPSLYWLLITHLHMSCHLYPHPNPVNSWHPWLTLRPKENFQLKTTYAHEKFCTPGHSSGGPKYGLSIIQRMQWCDWSRKFANQVDLWWFHWAKMKLLGRKKLKFTSINLCNSDATLLQLSETSRTPTEAVVNHATDSVANVRDDKAVELPIN